MTAFCRHDPRKEGAVRSASIACGSGENQLFSSRSRISPASVGFALRLLNFITSVIITIHLDWITLDSAPCEQRKCQRTQPILCGENHVHELVGAIC